MDYTVEDSEENQKSWADDLPDDTTNAQSIMEDRELLCALYQKLQELDQEGRRICELIMKGKSERDITSALGVAAAFFAANEAIGLQLDYDQERGLDRIGCIKTAFNAYKRIGEERYKEAMTILKTAWDGEPDSFRTENGLAMD